MIDVINARRVSALSDNEINALLDAHLFAKARLCLGIARPDDLGVWRCPWCGEIDDRAIASRLFDDPPWHRRQTPRYTIAQIVYALQSYSASTQIAYSLSLRAQILGESARAIRRSPLAEETQIDLHVNDRIVGVAALKALGIIDEQGFVKEESW